MRQIEVDLDVFAAIWSARMPSETTENDILRRLLLDPKSGSMGAAMSQPEGRDTAQSSQQGEQKEFFTSKPLEVKQPRQGNEETMGKIRWVDDVRMALHNLGGRAPLMRIYHEVERRRREGGRSVPDSIEATIRRTIEDHSSDSDNFRGTRKGDRLDIFTKVERGEWALR